MCQRETGSLTKQLELFALRSLEGDTSVLETYGIASRPGGEFLNVGKKFCRVI
jgi:hypothetical protein